MLIYVAKMINRTWQETKNEKEALVRRHLNQRSANLSVINSPSVELLPGQYAGRYDLKVEDALFVYLWFVSSICLYKKSKCSINRHSEKRF